MNIKKTIQNIRNSCDSYIDPDLLVFIIKDNNLMGTNNILELKDYDIIDEDNYEDRILKIHKYENIFIPLGMMTFIPFVNECDIFTTQDYNLKLSEEEFEKYNDEKEKLFGILVKKDSNNFQIGKTDTCSCSVDASFEEFEKTELNFYKTIKKIVNEKIHD